MQKAINVFGAWAEQGKDIGMEKGHAEAVNEMLDFAIQERKDLNKNFSFLDLGCGNGWVVRKVAENSICSDAHGIDGAAQMIANARKQAGHGKYILANIDEHEPTQKYDLIHSMEVFYYFENPGLLVKHINNNWIKSGGRLIMGIDYYQENKASHSWPEECCITIMKLYSEKEWKRFFKKAGLKNVMSWRNGKDKDWGGTLIVTGTN